MHDHTHDDEPGKLSMILFALGVIALGVSMWVWPDAVGDGTINGRRTLLKVIITNVWGPVTGTILCLFGGLVGWGTLSDDDEVTSS